MGLDEKVFNWTCPYCGAKTTIVDKTNYSKNIHFYASDSNYKHIGLLTELIVCPNPECKELSISASLYHAVCNHGWSIEGEPINSWQLRPPAIMKPLPDYIPLQIQTDYKEACSIVSLSPKASATLSRRCLQGMIHDFWHIKKNNLWEEINALKSCIDIETWDAIDSIRVIGNIGAHMEKDVNMIIDVDTNEASILIKLLEELFENWYIAKHEKEIRHLTVIKIANEMKELRKTNNVK
jgi:hypothetical protein